MYRTYFIALWFLFVTQSMAQPAKPVANDPATRLKTLSQQARGFLDRQQPDSAWQVALKPGLPLLKQAPDTAVASRQFRYELISCYTQKHEISKVISQSKDMIFLCRQVRDLSFEGKTRQLLITTYAELGMYQECISESLENIPLFQHLQDLEMLAKTYNFLAWAYQQEGNVVQWERHTRLAIKYGKLANEPRSRTVSFLNEGNLYVQKKQFDKAIKTFRVILPEIEANPALRGYLPDGYRCLAEGLQQAGQFTEALKVANTGLDKCRQYGNSMAEIANYLTIATVYAALHKNEASLEVATHALSLTTKNVPPIARQEALRVLSEAQERVGNYAAALKATRQLAALTDSLNTINKAEAIVTAETRFDVKAKNETINLLNKNATLKQQQTQQQQQTAGIVIGFLVLGLGIIGFSLFREHKTGTVLKRQKAEIETQATKLAELNGIKDQLFSIVSHDLRGPVMSLQQTLDRLETTVDTTAATTALPEALPRFRQSVNAVASLTDNILCWALSQMGGLRTRPQPFAVMDIVSDVLGLYEETIRQKNIELIVDNEPAGEAAPLALADENQAEIAIRNIVQNALKFSPAGGKLTLSVEPQVKTGEVSLLILDEGPGFDWQPGKTAPGKTSITRASTNSTGLGLTVVEDLMHRNGGTLMISGRTDGPAGTVARLTWPAQAVQNSLQLSLAEAR